ncbi:hydroxymethylglutaryl-CoA synthase [Candidatus Gottesmanbacteria bacterium]|nr:hydroxymethylglutaryl-CoA synthase [Candidatus Gottesmanbacteria bacterium]
MIGIISYGTYIPRYRIRLSDIALAWKKNPEEVIGSLGIAEKSVPGIDEDAVTVAIEAGIRAIGGISPGKAGVKEIGALFVGSESHPYAVNPTSTIVGELLGVGNNYLAADLEFACKAGTAGMQAIAGLIEAKHIRYGLAIGSDTAQSKPHDALEYTSACAGAAYILGSKRLLAELLAYTSYSSDTPDFWRRDGIRYPSHAGRFTGEPAYFAHVVGASKLLMEKTKMSPSDVSYCVFHMPNGKFPREVAKRLGFSKEQLAPSLTVDTIGNPYSASSMLGLAAVLDIAKPGEKIFMVSYGSGAGSDAFLWEVTREISKRKPMVQEQIGDKTYIDYVQYLKQTHKI